METNERMARMLEAQSECILLIMDKYISRIDSNDDELNEWIKWNDAKTRLADSLIAYRKGF